MPDRDGGVWHAFMPGVGAGQAYGYRATGPTIRARSALQPGQAAARPYALATTGEVRFGPEVLGHLPMTPIPSTSHSAAHVPRSLVVDTAYE